MPNVLKLANYHSAKAPPPTHVLGCQCLALRHYKGQAVQSFELLVSPAAALWHPQLRKTCSKRVFPLPPAHMHTHAASERADTHMCRKQARHLPDILCGLARALCNRHWFNRAPGSDLRGTEMGVTYLPSALAQTLAMPIYPYPYWVPQSARDHIFCL